MPRPRTLALLAALALGVAAGCRGGGGIANADMNTGQTIIELTDAVTSLQQRNAEMQGQIDSLQRALARQDTVITRLAAVSGVAVPPPIGGIVP
jgi:hypothetical protein